MIAETGCSQSEPLIPAGDKLRIAEIIQTPKLGIANELLFYFVFLDIFQISKMTEQPQSLRELLQTAKAQKQSLESSTEPNSDFYRGEVSAVIAKLEQCQKLISQLSLFSSNEALEDIATADLQYDAIPLFCLP